MISLKKKGLLMRLALISDIHGNLVALETVLTAIAQRNIDTILCLGDVAAGGPQPTQVIERLQQMNCPVVMGNTDTKLLTIQPKQYEDVYTQKTHDIDVWCAQQLTDSHKAYIQTFQPTLTHDLPHNRVLLAYHGSPRSFREILKPTTPDEVLEEAFAGFQADIMIGGHTHMQMFRRYKNILVLNPGSVGAAMDRVSPFSEMRNAPWAEYAILDTETNDLHIELFRVPFDIEKFIAITLASGMPHAEWSAGEWNRV